MKRVTRAAGGMQGQALYAEEATAADSVNSLALAALHLSERNVLASSLDALRYPDDMVDLISDYYGNERGDSRYQLVAQVKAGEGKPVTAVAFSSNSEMFMSGSKDGWVGLWYVPVANEHGGQQSSVGRIEFSVGPGAVHAVDVSSEQDSYCKWRARRYRALK